MELLIFNQEQDNTHLITGVNISGKHHLHTHKPTGQDPHTSRSSIPIWFYRRLKGNLSKTKERERGPHQNRAGIHCPKCSLQATTVVWPL
jgi:hypothetical protein